MKTCVIVCSVLILALAASSYAQCNPACSGNTPICSGSTCVACTEDSQCWAISSNSLVCNATSGACGNCTASTSCPDEAPICSTTTKTCTACNATAECSKRLPGSVCDGDSGLCAWCTSDAECTSGGYGSSSKCQNVTTGVRKCSLPSASLPAGADPNNINGIITAYVIICIVLLVLFVMFIACACMRDDDYSPENAPPMEKENRTAHHGKANGKVNGTSNGHGKEVELEDKPFKAKPKK